MKNCSFLFLFVLVCIISLSSCGNSSDSDEIEGKLQDNGFQINGSFDPTETYPDFKLLEVFDGWGSLEEVWDNIEAKGPNDALVETVDLYTDEFVTFSNVASRLLIDPGTPIQHLLSTELRNILWNLIDPTEPYRATNTGIGEFYTGTGAGYTAGFYDHLDALWEGDNRPGDKALVDVFEKIVVRQSKKDAATIRDDMQELVDDILDDDFTDDFTDLAELIGKLLIQADYPLWVNGAGTLLTRDEIDPENPGHTNLGIGNAVQGVNGFANWFNSMLVDAESREEIYGVLRESVKMFDPDPASENSGKVQQLLMNLEDHFTVGGSVYETNPLYKSGALDLTYTDTELGQTIREFLPHLTQLLVRSDRPTSVIANEDGSQPVYLLREVVDILKGAGFNPDGRSIEDSLSNMMRYDQWGRDRLDAGSEAYDASHLESLIFLTNLSTNFGWKDARTETGETTDPEDPTTEHGHGAYTGVLTLNDSLISMTTHKTDAIVAVLGLYDIALLDTQKEHISRSYVPFNTGQMGSYMFDYDQDYGVLSSMPGTCSGYIGTPDGGNRTGTTVEKNTYAPFNPTGLGESQLAPWTVNWAGRACIGGEGPYYYEDPDAELVSFGGKQYYKYLRPDGKIYAFVNKDNEAWEYIYPVDDKDAEDPETDIIDYNGKRERFNRYKSTWNSDYYLSQFSGDEYRTIDNSSGNLEIVELNSGDDARRLTYNEVIPEDDPLRACKSPEEALFRNYQWVYTEKKMVIILPQHLNLMGGWGGAGAVFMLFECNGYSGLANMRKYDANHVWAKKGESGASDIPGDYRVELVASIHGVGAAMLSAGTIYDHTLGTGHGTPSLVGRNLPSLYRLGFPLSPEIDRGNGVKDFELGSKEFKVGDATWENRNALLPIFVSLLGALANHTPSYESYDQDSMKNGIRGQVNGIAALGKPQIYYEKGGVGNAVPHNSWKMRVQGETRYNGWEGDYALQPAIFPGGVPTWNGSKAERLHYQPKTLKTLINVLIDSDITAPIEDGKRFDGVLPIITSTKAITPLVKVLMSDANDSDALYSSLEQILGAVKYTKGEMTRIYGEPTATKKIPFPEWMFATGTGSGDFGEYTGYENVRDEDIVLDKWLDRLIGHDEIVGHEGYGLANYVEEQEALSWVDFFETMDTLEDFLHPDSNYSLVESLINFSDEVFAREAVYPEEQTAGLLYSIGKLFTFYSTELGRWVLQGENGFDDIYNILRVRLPAIHDLVKDDTGENYKAMLTVNGDMLKDNINEDMIRNSGTVVSLLDTLSTDDGAEMVLNDLHGFLGDGIVTRPEPLWTTLAELLSDIARAVDVSQDGSQIDEIYEDFGFQKMD